MKKLKAQGGELVVSRDPSEEEMVEIVKDADAILTVYAEITEKVI